MFCKKNIDYVYLLWEDFLFQIENKEAKKTNKMSYPIFTKIIIDYFMSKDQSISRRNKMFGTLLEMTPSDSDTSPKQKPVQATKGTILKTKAKVAKSDKKKQPLATKRSKIQFHISQASSSCDGTDFESGVPDEQHLKTTGANEGTGTIPGVLDVPKYESKNDDDTNDKDDNDANDDDDDDDDDNQEGDDTNDDDEEIDSDRTESDRIKIPVLNQSSTKYYKEEEEKIDDEEAKDEEEDNKVTKELYDDVNVNLGNKDTKMTNAIQGGSGQQNVSQESRFEQVEEDAHVILTPVLETQKTNELVQSSSVSFDFTRKLLNLKNPSLADNEIASLMDTTARHATTVSEITSSFTITIPPPPPFFNSLLQQATPTPTPTTSEAATSFPSLPDFSYVFKFNDRVINLEKDLSEIKQVDQYAQALSSIPTIVDHYIDNKLCEAINKAILAHNLDCRQEA
ncbi:hypothetical protein Tco_0508546 [Tanacetum coccineum]